MQLQLSTCPIQQSVLTKQNSLAVFNYNLLSNFLTMPKLRINWHTVLTYQKEQNKILCISFLPKKIF